MWRNGSARRIEIRDGKDVTGAGWCAAAPTRDVSPRRRVTAGQKHMSRRAGFRDCGAAHHRLTNNCHCHASALGVEGQHLDSNHLISSRLPPTVPGAKPCVWRCAGVGGLRRRSGVRWWCWVWRRATVDAKPISDWTASGRDRMMSGLKPAQASAVFGPASSWKKRRDTRKVPAGLCVEGERPRAACCRVQRLVATQVRALDKRVLAVKFPHR